ncbi:MAG: RHS repeat-associated core domain-containing protein [Flavobacteriales bacterium]|nr:RHS repeat-associated core domain-containing protein [Flavobacteriales bacterium]MBK7941323.1 RHS repeat-associated core domain-containing protein [Flavobacteriales bacterium]MBK9701345.1 RHS repeat-associated core domain-containing protein [Flavobacteriales bacterium]
MGHGSVGEVVAGQANLPLYTTGTLGTAQRGLAVVDDRSGYGPTTLFLLDHQGGQLHLRALSVADLHADPGTPTWHTLESVPATSASTAGRLMPDPDGRRLAYVRAHGPNTGLLQWNNAELRVLHLAPDRLSLTGTPITWTTTNGRVTGLDFSPAGDYLYYTVSGLMYPGTQRLYRKPLSGGAPASVLNGVTDVRRNAQLGGAHMLGTTATGLVRIAQPDDASPGTSTYPLSGLRQALALQPVIIGPDRSTSTRQLGRRRYELTDHLGNVRVVLGDRKLSDFHPQNTPIPTHFSAEVMAYADYDPFGSLLPGRNYSAANYRWGFNGAEKDDEVHNATGTSYDFGARMYDPRVGRWLSLDPLSAKYPNLSPYAYVENSPIYLRDADGKEGVVSIKGNTITVTSHIYINGHGATAAKAKSMQRQIMGYWGKKQVYKDPATGQTYNVKFDIQVHRVEPDRPGQPPQEFKEGWNIITLVDPATRPDRKMEDGHFRSYVDGESMRTGEWDATADGETYAHETAHLLKLDDRYVDYTYEDFPGVPVRDRSLIGKIFSGTADNTERGSLVGAGSGPRSVVQQMVNAIGAYVMSTQKDGKATLSAPANLGSPAPNEVGRYDNPPLKIVPHTAH